MKVYALALAVSLAVLFTAGEGRAGGYLTAHGPERGMPCWRSAMVTMR